MTLRVVATALLNHRRRGSQGELVATCERLTTVLRRLGARISDSLVGPSGELREDAVRDAALLFMDADMIVATVPGQGAGLAQRRRAKIYTGTDVVYVVPDDKRLSLDLTKNIIVHFFVPRALVATAVSTPAPGSARPLPPLSQVSGLSPVPRATLEERVRTLSRLFKFEFMFRADATFEQNFAETLADMMSAGELAKTDGGDIVAGAGHYGLAGNGWIEFYASVALTFLESYLGRLGRSLCKLGRFDDAEEAADRARSPPVTACSWPER